MKKLFHTKSKIHSENIETDAQVKEMIKNLEEKIIAPLDKLIRSSSHLLSTLMKYAKDTEFLGEVFEKLGNPNLKRTEEDAAFVHAFARYADVLKLNSSNFISFVNDSNEKYIGPSSTFFKIELSDHLKVLKKQYERSQEDYSNCLLKLDSYHSTNKKKFDIEKLYALEKEKVRLRKIYENSILDLKDFHDDMFERVNFDLFEYILSYLDLLKNSLGLSYTELDELKDYNEELMKWCEEERYVFTKHTTEREGSRAKQASENLINDIKAFLSLFDSSLLEIIRPIGLSNELHSQDILPPLTLLFGHYNITPPVGFECQPASISIENALESVRLIVKNNIDAIGSTLHQKNMQDRLITLTEVLGSLENPVSNTNVQ